MYEYNATGVVLFLSANVGTPHIFVLIFLVTMIFFSRQHYLCTTDETIRQSIFILPFRHHKASTKAEYDFFASYSLLLFPVSVYAKFKSRKFSTATWVPSMLKCSPSRAKFRNKLRMIKNITTVKRFSISLQWNKLVIQPHEWDSESTFSLGFRVTTIQAKWSYVVLFHIRINFLQI